jgi:hypothetical protein
VLALLRYGKQGEPGVKPALLAFREAFANNVAPDRPGGRTEAITEFNKMVNGEKVARLLSEPDNDDWSEQLGDTTFDPGEQPAGDTDEHQGDAALHFTNGASFILDIPEAIPSLWGDGNNVLWAKGESFMVAGPMGLGKTTMLGLMVRNQLGLGNGQLLGLPIPPCDGKILYLAMDRPAQIARAMARQFKAADRETLAESLVFWKGPPPGDVARRPTLLLELAEAAGAAAVYLDSVKDAAVGLSDDYDSPEPEDIAAATELCTWCPALTRCSAYVESLPPKKRPAGVIAGQIHIPITPDQTRPRGKAPAA